MCRGHFESQTWSFKGHPLYASICKHQFGSAKSSLSLKNHIKSLALRTVYLWSAPGSLLCLAAVSYWTAGFSCRNSRDCFPSRNMYSSSAIWLVIYASLVLLQRLFSNAHCIVAKILPSTRLWCWARDCGDQCDGKFRRPNRRTFCRSFHFIYALEV